MSLYLKYRPQNFSTIVGQNHVVQTIKNSLKKNKVNHAYLFCGSRGTGKTSTARIIAKSLNCLQIEDSYNPCNQCENCKAINQNHLIDLIEIDAASNRGIDEIRELREKIQFSPTHGKAKVYIIDEVHMLTKEAFNALLKTLEEPPSHAYFILATTEAHKIPETIISRCQQFNFKRINQEDIKNRLKEISNEEGIIVDDPSLDLIARLAEGGLRDAIGLLEQIGANGEINYQEMINQLGIIGHLTLENFYQSLLEGNVSQCLKTIQEINNNGQNLDQFCSEFILFLRDLMIESVNKGQSAQSILLIIETFNQYKPQISKSSIPQLPLEIAAIKVTSELTSEPSMHNKSHQLTEKKNPEIKSSTEEAPKAKEETNQMKGEEKSIEKEVQTEVQTKAIDISIESIIKDWSKVIQSIETPFVKMSLMGSKPIKMERGDLYLQFQSTTLMEKVGEPNSQNEVIDTIEKLLNIRPNLKLEVKKIVLNQPDNQPEKNTSDTAELAEEVFGH